MLHVGQDKGFAIPFCVPFACPLFSQSLRIQSGRQDSNLRPSAPKAPALPSCATPRNPHRVGHNWHLGPRCRDAAKAEQNRYTPDAPGHAASVEIRTSRQGMGFPSTPNSGSGPIESESPDALLGRSCMKWGEDGELSAVDLQGILARLSAVDQQAARLMDCPLDG